MPKLRKLLIYNINHEINWDFEANHAIQLVKIVEDILEQRKVTEERGNLLDNSIEIIINEEQGEEFLKIENLQNNIKFTIVDKDDS